MRLKQRAATLKRPAGAAMLFLLVLSFTLPSQTADRISMRETPRALSAAVELLEHRFGWQITYEDPRYVYTGDLVDRTSPDYRGPLRAIAVRPGTIEVTYLPLAANPMAVI